MEFTSRITLRPSHDLRVLLAPLLVVYLLFGAIGAIAMVASFATEGEKATRLFRQAVVLLSMACGFPLLIAALIFGTGARSRFYRFDDQGIHDIGVPIEFGFSWHAVRRLGQVGGGIWVLTVRPSLGFLFFNGQNRTIILPADQLSGDIKSFILQQVHAHGGTTRPRNLGAAHAHVEELGPAEQVSGNLAASPLEVTDTPCAFAHEMMISARHYWREKVPGILAIGVLFLLISVFLLIVGLVQGRAIGECLGIAGIIFVWFPVLVLVLWRQILKGVRDLGQPPIVRLSMDEEVLLVADRLTRVCVHWEAIGRMVRRRNDRITLFLRGARWPRHAPSSQVLPADQLSDEVKSFIVQQVKAHGGRVS